MAVAAVSPERHETVALAWTKAAILDCLGQARQALERFAGEPGDLSMLAFVVDNLHQVHGCLRMLELRGATRLAEELELFAKAMADGQVSPRGDCLGALFRGLEQLPPYLERLRGAPRPAAGDAAAAQPAARLPGRAAGPGQPDAVLRNALPVPTTWPTSTCRWATGASNAGRAGRDALRSVVTALCDDLMRIKERLDQFVRATVSTASSSMPCWHRCATWPIPWRCWASSNHGG
jgi:chemosensory pili system protein ChpA (sensor histidine kinase/response regulator)